MKKRAAQAKKQQDDINHDRAMVCDVCGKVTREPWGYTRHGNGCVCSKHCQEVFDEMLAMRFAARLVRPSGI